jgi:molybdate transport system substrate-binding protein
VRVATLAWLLAAALVACGAAPPAAAAESRAESRPVTVFAAASLAEALGEIGALYGARGGQALRFSFAASSQLARQIEVGADADLYFAADEQWMDYLEARGLVERATRRSLLGNRLVLIAPADSRVTLAIGPGFPLAAALGDGRLACADPDSVPAGRYAREALERLGLWERIGPRLARAENVRAALALVARGEAPLGIVYETDAAVERRVRTVDVFPAGLHAPISYPLALTRGATPRAAAFLAYLEGPEARAVFEKYRFSVLR